MKPTEKELRELDAWIDANLFDGGKFVGLKKRGAGRYTREEAKKHEYLRDEPVTIHEFPIRRYTESDGLSQKVLEKCVKSVEVKINWIADRRLFRVGGYVDFEKFDSADAETLPLAICLFSKQLFTKL